MRSRIMGLLLLLFPFMAISQIQVATMLDSIYFHGGREHVGYLLDSKEREINFIIPFALKDVIETDDSPKAVRLRVFDSDRQFYRTMPRLLFPVWIPNSRQRRIERKDQYILQLMIESITQDYVKVKVNIGRVNRQRFVAGEWEVIVEKQVDFVYSYQKDGLLQISQVQYLYPQH